MGPSRRRYRCCRYLPYQMDYGARVLGEEHSDTLTMMANLAFTLKSRSRNKEAISLIKRCFKLRKEVLSPRHPDTETLLEALHR